MKVLARKLGGLDFDNRGRRTGVTDPILARTFHVPGSLK